MTWRRHVSGQRLGVSALALLAYLPALFAAPGRMPSDTKLYLYLDPGRLISEDQTCRRFHQKVDARHPFAFNGAERIHR